MLRWLVALLSLAALIALPLIFSTRTLWWMIALVAVLFWYLLLTRTPRSRRWDPP